MILKHGAMICALALQVNCSSTSRADPCTEVCSQDPVCSAHGGSYCRTDKSPHICRAYYFDSRERTSFYYHTSGDSRSQEITMRCEDAARIVGSWTSSVESAELAATTLEPEPTIGEAQYASAAEILLTEEVNEEILGADEPSSSERVRPPILEDAGSSILNPPIARPPPRPPVVATTSSPNGR